MMVKKDFNKPLNKEELNLASKIVKEAEGVGVNNIINVGTSLIETQNSIAIAKQNKNVFVAAAIHPCDLSDDWKKDFEQIKKIVSNKEQNKVVAIGESGLDFYHKPFNKQRQIDAFKMHIELALKNDLPIIVHVRDSVDESLRVLEEYKGQLKCVNHAFFAGKDVADILIDWGFYLGISAPITYPKNNELRNLVKQLPLENILLETDAPFLPPQQFRGKQNNPKYIPLIAKFVAELRGEETEEFAAKISLNVDNLFGIKKVS